MMNRVRYRLVAVVLFEIEVFLPPLDVRSGVPTERTDKGAGIGAIINLIGSLVGYRLRVVSFDLIEVAIRQSVFVQEVSIRLFDGQIKTLEIALILIRSVLVFAFDK